MTSSSHKCNRDYRAFVSRDKAATVSGKTLTKVLTIMLAITSLSREMDGCRLPPGVVGSALADRLLYLDRRNGTI